MDDIWIAFFVAVLSPAVLAFLTQWSARTARREDWKRQDEVAAAAVQAANKLAEESRRAAQNTDSKLEHVVKLTNSNHEELKKEIAAYKDEIRVLNERLLESKGKEGRTETT